MEDLKFSKCADCKFWDRDEDVGNSLYHYGFGMCTAISLDWMETTVGIDHLAVAACHAEKSEGELLTKAEFSCRLFEFSGRPALT